MTDIEATQTLHETMPLCATLGMRAEQFTADGVVLALDWADNLCTSNAMLHGGVVMALADSAGGACAFLNLPEGAAGTSTIESKTNFLGAIRGGTVRATATPLHVGGSTIVIETVVRVTTAAEARPAEDKLVAKVTQTQTVLRPRS